MAEMNPVARWFVNHFKARANVRLYDWVASHLTLPPASICLEVGCGNANMAVRIFDGMGPARLVATDVDPRQLDAARRLLEARYAQAVPAGLELRPADLVRLPFPDAGFDAVFAFAALHHAGAHHRDPSRLGDALTEVDRVLRPAGVLVYEEFLHKPLLRRWLAEHGYREQAHRGGWRRECAVWSKPSDASAGSSPSPGPAGAPPADGSAR
jgi:ubiquinone/menaquinone biosynthesis C-methylase UbiE